MVLWEGSCIVHEAFSVDKLIELHNEHPNAKIIAHPESEEPLLKTAQFIGSTAQLLKFVKEDEGKEFIVATEAGILHQMMKEVPNKTLIPAPSNEDNTCACSECAFMKQNTLEKLYLCMKYGSPEINLSQNVIEQGRKPIERMLKIS